MQPAPELFSPEAVEAGLVEVAGKPRGQFSGGIIERQAELVDVILERFASGASQREIARVFSVSTNTIAGIVARATAAGRIEAYKTRVSAKLAGAIEGGIEVWTDALRAGTLNPRKSRWRWGYSATKRRCSTARPRAGWRSARSSRAGRTSTLHCARCRRSRCLLILIQRKERKFPNE